jgi:hexosaminidase
MPYASRTRVAALGGALLITACAPRVTAPRPAAPRDLIGAARIIPAPVSLAYTGQIRFAISAGTGITVPAGDAELARIGEQLGALLRPSTGFPVAVMASDSMPASAIVLRRDAATGPADSYRLVVTPERITISASEPSGVFRGIQTLRQMLPANIESHMRVSGAAADWTVPAVTIADQPRYAWRGAMLDVARHFFTVREVKQYIDLLALYKMNVLHLHLADDQGWRIEIKSRPQLVQMGSVTQVGGGPGGFYTQDDYAEIVRYAAERFITVVPEIDMPGHTNAGLVAFPHLGCGKWAPAPYTGTEVGFSSFCVEKDETYALIDDIVRELAAITPGPYFHMGGDEVEVLTPQQYATFVERVQEIVTRHGKTVVGWEEINKARLRPSTLIQQWRGDTLTPQGTGKLIMSPGRRLYLDMKYDSTTELGLQWAGLIDVRQTYDWDPATYNPGVSEPRIMGIEAPIWTETVRNVTALQYLAVPRIPSVAEVAWSPQTSREWENFRRRLATHAPRWNYLGINYHRSVQIPW